MLAELRMKLNVEGGNIGYYQSSNMQGILMTVIDSAYAEKLHEQSLRPYSQYIIGGESNEWIVRTMTEKAYENIILPLNDTCFKECYIDKKNIQISIVDKKIKTVNKKELLDEFYSDSYERKFNIRYLTPTSFKSNNQYVIIPDLRLIYQSLMNKYSASEKEMYMYDEDVLEQIVACSQISGYKLKSTVFPIEKVKIPSFIGNMTIKVTGNSTLSKYIRLLLRFGEYSGVGIKTAMGMGCFEFNRG